MSCTPNAGGLSRLLIGAIEKYALPSMMLGKPGEVTAEQAALLDRQIERHIQASNIIAFGNALASRMDGSAEPLPLPRASYAATVHTNPLFIIALCQRNLFDYDYIPPPFGLSLYDIVVGCDHACADLVNDSFTRQQAAAAERA